MTKLKFLLELEKRLDSLSQEDIEERLTFYSEMIEDRVEEGLSEEEAIAQIGSIEEIAAQILTEHPGEKPVAAEEIKITEEGKIKRRFKTWEIILLIVGSPLWISLLITVLAVVFSLVVSAFAVGFSLWISLWAVFVSLTACAVALPVAAVYFMCIGYLYSGLVVMSASMLCAGLAIFLFYGCKSATKGMVLLTKSAGVLLKRCIPGKEA